MNAAEHQPPIAERQAELEKPPEPPAAPGGASQENVAALAEHAKQTGEQMIVADVVDKLKPFERAAAAPRLSWVAPLGGVLFGGAIGAWFAGQPFGATRPLLAFLAGVLLMIFGRVFGWSRSENLDAICDDFAEYLQRWPQLMAAPQMSPEYKRLVGERESRRQQHGWSKLWWLILR